MTFSILVSPTIGTSQSDMASLFSGPGNVFNTISFFSDALPSDCAQPNPVNLLASGSMNIGGHLTGIQPNNVRSITVTATGVVACFRVWDGSNLTCTAQGTCTLAGGGGDMIFDDLNVTSGDVIGLNAFQLAVSVV